MGLSEAPYWWASVMEAAPPRETRPLPERPDVAILGAGYTGLSAARTLARAGAAVVVLEKETLGWGASSRNGGQVLTGMKLGPECCSHASAESGPGRCISPRSTRSTSWSGS